MQIGLLTLGDLLPDPATGVRVSEHERHRSLVEQAVTAEANGFHAVHLGEHHGSDYHLSAPPVVLGAIGERTTSLRLSTGVTLAANLDPVRVAEDYATVDVLSNGRAEIVCGRGSYFARTFDFFGQDSTKSSSLFDEHVRLISRLLTEEEIDSVAGHRSPLSGFTSRPRPVGHIPMWIGGGSSTSTIDLAAELGCALMLPSVFAPPQAFAPMVERYREKFAAAGHAGEPKVGACCHCHIAETTEQAIARFEPAYGQYWNWVQDLIADFTPHAPRMDFDYDQMLAGPALVGSADAVTERASEWQEMFDLDRLIMMFDLGGQPLPIVLECIERVGTDVLPHLAA